MSTVNDDTFGPVGYFCVHWFELLLRACVQSFHLGLSFGSPSSKWIEPFVTMIGGRSSLSSGFLTVPELQAIDAASATRTTMRVLRITAVSFFRSGQPG